MEIIITIDGEYKQAETSVNITVESSTMVMLEGIVQIALDEAANAYEDAPAAEDVVIEILETLGILG